MVKNVSDTGMAYSLQKMTLFQPSLKYLDYKIERGLTSKGDKYKLFFINSTLSTSSKTKYSLKLNEMCKDYWGMSTGTD